MQRKHVALGVLFAIALCWTPATTQAWVQERSFAGGFRSTTTSNVWERIDQWSVSVSGKSLLSVEYLIDTQMVAFTGSSKWGMCKIDVVGPGGNIVATRTFNFSNAQAQGGWSQIHMPLLARASTEQTIPGTFTANVYLFVSTGNGFTAPIGYKIVRASWSGSASVNQSGASAVTMGDGLEGSTTAFGESGVYGHYDGTLWGSGVYGSGTGDGDGVYGVALGTGDGVFGDGGAQGVGVHGHSTGAGNAVMGEAEGTGSAVYGRAFENAYAIRGSNSEATGWAGHFTGRVFLSQGYSSSDARLKRDIRPLDRGLEQLLKLRPVSFKWKKGSEEPQLGLIAQEVQKTLPGIVTTDTATGMLAVNYTALVPLAIEAIQEQQQVIERQEARIAALESARGPVMSSIGGGLQSYAVIGLLALGLVFAIRRRSQRQ